jgi:protein disulfide-isomerase-like protein
MELVLLVVIAIAVIIYMSYSYNSHSHVVNSSGSNSLVDTVPIENSDSEEPAAQASQSAQAVLFYAPWCGHCKSILPVWDNLSKRYPHMVKVNCDEQPDVAKEHSIKGFPTIKLFINDQVYEYQGDRSLEDIEKFISY